MFGMVKLKHLTHSQLMILKANGIISLLLMINQKPKQLFTSIRKQLQFPQNREMLKNYISFWEENKERLIHSKEHIMDLSNKQMRMPIILHKN